MEKFKAFLKRKDIEISLKRYGIDALGAMAQGLFCSLLIGTIINTIGTQFHIPFLTLAVATVNDTQYTVGSLASAMSGPAMAVAIGYALHCPPLVLFFADHRWICLQRTWRSRRSSGCTVCCHCCS